MSEVVEEFPTSVWSETPMHPWHRFFARVVDMSISGFIYLWLALMTVTFVNIDRFAREPMDFPYLLESSFNFLFSGFGQLLHLMVTAIVSIFINAVLIGSTGGSLGKFLFGIRVLDKNGNQIGFKRALRREFIIWFRGLGFGIPVVCLFPMYVSFKTLHKNGVTKWDEDLDLKVEYKRYNKKQNILRVIGLIISISWLLATIEGLVSPWLG